MTTVENGSKQSSSSSATSSSWKPETSRLEDILLIFRQSQNPDPHVQQQILHALQKLQDVQQDFLNYLCFIFVQLPSELPEVRQAAGLALKNNLIETKVRFGMIGAPSPELNVKETMMFVVDAVCKALGDSSVQIRQTASTIVASITKNSEDADILQGTITRLVCLLEECQQLKPGYEPVLHSTLDCLKKLVEEIATDVRETIDWSQDEETETGKDTAGAAGAVPGVSGKVQSVGKAQIDAAFLDVSTRFVIPKTIQLARAYGTIPPDSVAMALNVLNTYSTRKCFVADELGEDFFEEYFMTLGTLAAIEGTPSLLKRTVVEGILSVLDYRCDAVTASLEPVAEFIFQCCTNSDDYNLCLTSLGFWPPALRVPGIREKFVTNGADYERAILSKLVPLLLQNMRYSTHDYMQMDASFFQEDDAGIADRSSDIPASKPEDPGEWQQSSWGDVWTVRKAAALALDNVAVSFSSELVLEIVLPLIEGKLQTQEAELWEIRESGLLALGAIAQGCMSGLSKYAEDVLNLLMNLSAVDRRPLVRSISCWCLSRFVELLCSDQFASKWLAIALDKLCDRLLDRSKCVQDSAVSAVAMLEETAGERIMPMCERLLDTYRVAMSFYQAKNLLILYDAISSFVKACGTGIIYMDKASPAVKIKFMDLWKAILTRWHHLSPKGDVQFMALAECVIAFVGHGREVLMKESGRVVTAKTVELLKRNLDAIQTAATTADDDAEDTFLSYTPWDVNDMCIDLLASIIDHSDSATAQDIVRHCPVFNILDECCANDLVRSTSSSCQSLFALIGDLAKRCTSQFSERAQMTDGGTKYVTLACENLTGTPWQLSSNAVWAISQLSRALSPDVMDQYAGEILRKTLVLLDSQYSHKALRINAAMAVGRMGFCSGRIVCSYIPTFIKPWSIMLAGYRNDAEKIAAFKGLGTALTFATPEILVSSCTSQFMAAIASLYVALLENIPPDQEVVTLLPMVMGEHAALAGPHRMVAEIPAEAKPEFEQVTKLLKELLLYLRSYPQFQDAVGSLTHAGQSLINHVVESGG